MSQFIESGELEKRQIEHLRLNERNSFAPATHSGMTDAEIIRTFFDAARDNCLKKNADYGASVFKPPVLAPGLPCDSAILVRMSDEINRLATLLQTGTRHVTDESTEDTMMDLGTYAFLWVIAQRRGKQ